MKRKILPKTIAAVTAFAAVFTPALPIMSALSATPASAETMAERNERIAAEIIEAGVDPIDFSESDATPSYSYHICVGSGKEDCVRMENGSLSLPFLLENTGKDMTFGVKIFADGIAQSYTCGSSKTPSEMKIFTVKSGQTLKTTLFAEKIATASDKETVSLTAVLVPCPNREEGKIYGIGELSFLPTHLTLYTDNGVKTDEKIEKSSKSHKITDREDISFSIGKDFMDNTRRFALTPKGSDRHYDAVIPAGENGTVDITLNAYTTYKTDGSYRVSFFRNGKRTAFNDGCDYLDIILKNGMMTTADITLEAAPGDCLYCIACPLDNLDNIEIRPETSSLITVLAPEDMPEELPEDCYYYPVKLSPEQEQIRYEQIMEAMREAGLLD